MGRKRKDRELIRRIRAGNVRREDVVRRLAELAFGEGNDCVRLMLEKDVEIGDLDLSLLGEVKRSEKGTVEVKLIDRLQVLRQLAELAGEEGTGMETFLKVLGGGETE